MSGTLNEERHKDLNSLDSSVRKTTTYSCELVVKHLPRTINYGGRFISS